MSNIKRDLQAEIEAKIARRKLKKELAIENKSYRAAVFDFFKNIEEAKQLSKNHTYDRDIANSAWISLSERLSNFDPGCKVSIIWGDDKYVSGVAITWTNSFCVAHGTEKETYIDVTEMLLA